MLSAGLNRKPLQIRLSFSSGHPSLEGSVSRQLSPNTPASCLQHSPGMILEARSGGWIADLRKAWAMGRLWHDQRSAPDVFAGKRFCPDID